jgi:ferredoxin-NADP reductase
MSIVKKYKSEIADIIQPVENTYTISFKTNDKKYKYNPGQFLHLALEDYDGIGQWPESRCFSMQSNPADEHLKISYSVKGAFTQQMAKQLTIGKEVWIKLPYGDLFTQEHNKGKTVFVAGGTGITPFLSLFTSPWFEQYSNPVLYAGFRDESLHLYREELQIAQAINCGFTIHTIFENREGKINIEDIANENGDKADYFISGPPRMIKSFKNYLVGKGLKESQVKTDDWE